jgi:hypothetical protein
VKMSRPRKLLVYLLIVLAMKDFYWIPAIREQDPDLKRYTQGRKKHEKDRRFR